MKKPIVLYIGGAGRSGSTLLDVILGNTAECVAVGEVKHFFEYFTVNPVRCGCGSPLRECSFWKAVVARAEFSEPELLRAAELNLKFNRSRNAPQLQAKLRRAPELAELSAYFERLYAAVLDVSGKTILVDNSKSPAHLLLLRRGFDLRLLHLVRHPVAVAYSWNRRTKSDPAAQGAAMQRRGLAASVARWAFENGLIAGLRAGVARYHLLRYEDFAAAPADALRQAFQALELEGLALKAPAMLDAELVSTHSVGGNPIRFSTGKVKIRLDADWKTAMPAWRRVALELLIFPWLRKFGYAL